MENISEKYLEELNTSDQPIVVLTRFYCELYTLSNIKDYLRVFDKLLRLYSRKNIFLAILDTYDVDDFRLTDPYGLLSYFLKKRLESKVNPINRIDVKQLEFQYNHARDDLKDLIMQDPFEEKNANQDI